MILTSWLQGRKKALEILGPPGTKEIVTALLDKVYGKDIEFRTKGALAKDWSPVETTDRMGGLAYDGGQWKVFAEVVEHGSGLDFPDSFKRRWVCLGYRVEAEGKVVAISGDSVDCAGLDRLALDADVLVQCCYLARAEITTAALERLAKDTIACSDAVGGIAKRARVKKLVLTHFSQMSESMMRRMAADVARDYDGPVLLGGDLDEIIV